MSTILIALLPFAIFMFEPKSTHQVLILDKSNNLYLSAIDCSTVAWTKNEKQLWDVIKIDSNDFLLRHKKFKSFLCLMKNRVFLCFSKSAATKFNQKSFDKDIQLIYCLNQKFNYMKDVYLYDQNEQRVQNNENNDS